eukprot:symbB.v1.2.004757.t2/scaffold242.1/size254583/4
MDFYFSDANLRRDRYMKQRVDEGDGSIALDLFLSFNRIKALGVTELAQLVEAVQASPLLNLTEQDTKVRRDFTKHPLGTYDPVQRTLYVEGLPLTFGIDDLTKFFSSYGQVKLVEVPQHRETREPRGFAFVEFASVEEAEEALNACQGLWPPTWPQRFDGKTLRVMKKAQWHQQCREYKQLQAISHGPSFAGRKKDLPPPTPTASPPETMPPEVAASAAASSSAASGAPRPKPARTPGCLVKLTGLAEDDESLCTLSVRQFAEHAVTVEYCDFVPSTSSAHVRLKCPEDGVKLLEDLKLTGRMLGCHQVTAEVLGPEEEELYWKGVMQRAEQRGPPEVRQTAKRKEPEHVVSRIRRWRPVLTHSGPSGKFKAGFTDTAGGSADFVQSGFGKHSRPKKAPKVIPPRKREAEGEATASQPSKARKTERIPAVPPASPALPPPSPCGLDESMSPDSDVASGDGPPNSPKRAARGKPAVPPAEEDFDPDEIVSMMEDFAALSYGHDLIECVGNGSNQFVAELFRKDPKFAEAFVKEEEPRVKRISNKITKSYLMDPYAMMMHYKRAFKLLDAMKRNSAKVLILGNKNQFGISWKGHFAGVEFDTGVVDEKLISGATKHYEMILCLDPVLYCRSLYKINLPVMMCATPREITEHPEILDVTDYLLPSPTRRHDAALRAMVGLDVLGESPDSSDPGLEATREVRGFPAKNDKSASPQRTGLEQKKEEKKDGDGEASPAIVTGAFRAWREVTLSLPVYLVLGGK